MGVRDLDLHIGEIVVTGAGPVDRDQLRAAVTTELTRLLQAHPVNAEQLRSRSMKQLELGSLRLSQPVRAESLGKQLAGQLQQFLAIGPAGSSRHSGPGSRGAKR